MSVMVHVGDGRYREVEPAVGEAILARDQKITLLKLQLRTKQEALDKAMGEVGTFNVNHDAWVRLTDRGREMLKRQHDDMQRELAFEMPYEPVAEDDDGWSKWQLWCLMQDLGGSNMAMGPPVTFETEIRFADPALAGTSPDEKEEN